MSTFETTLGHAFDSIFIQFSPILYFAGRGPVWRCRWRASQSWNVDDPRDLPTGLPFPLPPPHEENQETVQPLRAILRSRLLRRVHGATQGSHWPSHSQRTYAGTIFYFIYMWFLDRALPFNYIHWYFHFLHLLYLFTTYYVFGKHLYSSIVWWFINRCGLLENWILTFKF